MQEYYSIVTNYGKQKEINCLAGKSGFDIEEIALGDGNGSLYEPDADQTALKNEVWRGKIDKVDTETNPDGSKTLFAVVHIPANDGGFTMREAGVYDKSGNLVILAKTPEEKKRLPETGAIKQLSIRIDLSVLNEAILPFLIDPSINTATVEYCDNHYQNLNQKGEASGYAPLDENSLVPLEYLPEAVKKQSSGLSMFQIVQEDHELSFEESKGKARLGTYAYKTGVAGSRYGYPSFYNRCLSEYQDSSNAEVILKNNVTASGVTIDNGVYSVSGRNYVITESAINLNAANTWEVVISAVTPSTITNQALIGNIGGVNYLMPEFRFNSDSSKLLANLSSNGSSWDMPTGSGFVGTKDYSADTHYFFKLEFDGSAYIISYSEDTALSENMNWIEDARYASTTKVSSNTNMCIGNHIYSSSNQYPWNGTIDLKNCYIKIDGQIIWQGTTTALKNANKHIFYDIADKPVIDAIFAQRGEAMFFGIDTENERIFLPRRTRTQATSNPDDVNKFVEAGLPDIPSHTHSPLKMTGSNADAGDPGSYAITNAGQNNGQRTFDNSVTGGVNSRSADPIYGNSDTVQYSCSLVLEYMIVGNTEAEIAQTDVVEITTSENDTLPRYYNFYSEEDMTATGAYVNASTGAYLSGSLWNNIFADLVSKIGEPFCAGVVKEHTATDITDYDVVVNQTDMTFRLPLLNGSEDLPGNVAILTTFALPQAGTYTYTAPKNGLFVWNFVPSATAPCTTVIALVNGRIVSSYQSNGYTQSVQAFAKKGDTITVQVNNNTLANAGTQHFIYAKGAGQLYFKLGNALQNLDVLNGAGVLSALNLKTDAQQAANAAMPSDRYIDLTLGASGSQYTAPADGWINLVKMSNATNQNVVFETFNNSTLSRYLVAYCPQTTSNIALLVPVSKNEKFSIRYTAGGATNTFKFIYAQGAPSV